MAASAPIATRAARLGVTLLLCAGLLAVLSAVVAGSTSAAGWALRGLCLAAGVGVVVCAARLRHGRGNRREAAAAVAVIAVMQAGLLLAGGDLWGLLPLLGVLAVLGLVTTAAPARP